MKYCEDCIHYGVHGKHLRSVCTRSFEEFVIRNTNNICSEAAFLTSRYCYEERRDGKLASIIKGTCGKSGRFFKLRLAD